MDRPDAFRYRIKFAKTAEMRYTGHLDLQRTWERLLRRARVPLLFTQGFHPRPRFNLAAALPLGFTGEAELIEVYLTHPVDPGELTDRLRASSPPGIRVDDVTQVASRVPAVQTLIEAAEYTVTLIETADGSRAGEGAGDVRGHTDLAEAVTALLAADGLPRERRGKTYDLRPLVEAVEVVEGAEVVEGVDRAVAMICMRLRHREGATGRPDEVLLALGMDPAAAMIRRERLVLRGM